MKRLVAIALLLLTTALPVGLAPRLAAAQIYRWIDDQGAIHYSQGIESVPMKHRAGAVIIGYDRPAPETPPVAATQSGARISFTPGQPIMVTARINAAGTARLMLDTGASRTVINPAVLQALGVSYRDARRGSIRGVTGEAEVLAVRVESVDVSGAAHGPLMVVAHDTGFALGDGLLGRDFLDHFTVTIDNGAGIVTLVPK